ncbi:MAG: transcription initiation factor TFIIIB [Bacillota bacterium]|nr:transcription initiation factor TFIIIB [Bacillota bacterium]
MIDSDTTKCPKCGSSEIGQGKLSGYAALSVVGKMFSGSAVIADVCSDCGYIIQMKVKDPEKFKRR